MGIRYRPSSAASSEPTQAKMNKIIFAAVLAVAAALPQHNDEKLAAVVRDERVAPGAGGEYSFDLETDNGIFRSESGVGVGEAGAVNSQGVIRSTFPNGEPYELSFVADANGYKPDSSLLPVAPAFPHPIPQFVLDQIAFANEQRAARAAAEAAQA